MRVLVTREIHPDAVKLLRSHFEVEYRQANEPLDPAWLAAALHQFDGVLSTVSEKFGAALMEQAGSRLRVISNMASGLDNIDTVKAAEMGIKVCNIPDTTIDATADMTIGIALTLIRQVIPAQRFIAAGQWRAWDPMIFQGRTLSELTWGIYGMGRIGQGVARRVAGFGCNLIYVDPVLAESELPPALGGRRVELPELLASADIISLHAPLTADTAGLFNASAFAAMKPSAFLVNMARGPLVNSDDLLAALKAGDIAGAALDVFDPEPLSGDHPILGLDNVVFTPHIGTSTLECRRDMAVRAAENLINSLSKGQS